LWDMEAGRVVKTITAGGPVGRNFAVSPDGHFLAGPVLAAPAGGGTIKILDIGNGDIVRTFEKQDPSTFERNFGAIGQRDVLRIFDSSDVEKWGYATLIAFDPSGNFILSDGILPSGFTNVSLWDARQGRLVSTLGTIAEFDSLSFSPNGQFALTAG